MTHDDVQDIREMQERIAHLESLVRFPLGTISEAPTTFAPPAPLPLQPRLRICGVELSVGDREEAKWPINHLNWFVEGNLPGVVRDVFRREIAEALASWSAVANLVFTEVPTAQGAHIIMHARRLDGAGRVLAQSELPPANPCDQDYDFENWSTDATPGSGQIELQHVIAHEVGHALGLLHDDQNADALMAPFYSAGVSKPRPRDVARIQALYGPPVTSPPPPPPPPPGGSRVRVEVTGADAIHLPRAPTGQVLIEIVNASRIAIPGYKITPEA